MKGISQKIPTFLGIFQEKSPIHPGVCGVVGAVTKISPSRSIQTILLYGEFLRHIGLSDPFLETFYGSFFRSLLGSIFRSFLHPTLITFFHAKSSSERVQKWLRNAGLKLTHRVLSNANGAHGLLGHRKRLSHSWVGRRPHLKKILIENSL